MLICRENGLRFSCIKANVQQRKKLISARHRKVCLTFALKKKKIKLHPVALHLLSGDSLLRSLLSFFVLHSWSFLIGRDICLKCVRRSTSSK